MLSSTHSRAENRAEQYCCFVRVRFAIFILFFFISRFPFFLILCRSFYFTYKININMAIWQEYKMLYMENKKSQCQQTLPTVRAKVRVRARQKKEKEKQIKPAHERRGRKNNTRDISESLPAYTKLTAHTTYDRYDTYIFEQFSQCALYTHTHLNQSEKCFTFLLGFLWTFLFFRVPSVYTTTNRQALARAYGMVYAKAEMGSTTATVVETQTNWRARA